MALKAEKSAWQRIRSSASSWCAEHNGLACALIVCGIAIVLFGLAAFVAFSDFGSTATFIYNQF